MRVHDGAYGTLLGSHLHGDETVDDLCVRAPNIVVDAHRAYVESGANAIQTNSFLAHLRGSDRRRRELRHAALSCAREAAAAGSGHGNVTVFATIGPVGSGAREFWEPIEQALDAGVAGVLCETVTDAATALAFAAAWTEVGAGVRGVEVMLGLSAAPSGGVVANAWVAEVAADVPEEVQLGLNCCEGPAGLRPLLEDIAELRAHVWTMPSAGVPAAETATGPVWPFADAGSWSAAVFEAIDDLPVDAVGGCCGTSPDFIAALRDG